jgi:hypothetical protein
MKAEKDLEKNVHRHIELTAVSKEISKHIKRVRESEDLNKRLAFVYKKARKSRP